MSKVQVDTIDTRSGTSTMQIGSTNTSTINIGVSGDTVNIPSGVTIANAGTATGFGGDNTPYFYVYLGYDQNATSMSTVKVAFNTEVYDTANAYDNSTNYRYTPTTAGFYKFYTGVTYYADSSNLDFNKVTIKMNGSTVIGGAEVDMRSNRGRQMTGVAQCIQQMNGSSDYIEIYSFVASNGGSSAFESENRATYFGGYKLIT